MFQILIVDDDKNLKRGLSLLLTDSGYRTFSAGSAREALHTLEKCRIDLMVLEAALPGMDGLALTKLLRDCKNDLPRLRHLLRHHRRPGADPAPEGILPALQAPILPQPGIYPPAAHG